MKNVINNLMQKLIIKNTVQTNVAGLQLTAELWKNIMRKKQLEMVPLEFAKNVKLNYANYKSKEANSQI
jgi:hypothetical protein